MNPFCCFQGQWAVLPEKGPDVANPQGHLGLGLWAATPYTSLMLSSADRCLQPPHKDSLLWEGNLCTFRHL